MTVKNILHSAVLTFLATASVPHASVAQGTAFTYQGRLARSGVDCSGCYDFTFSLYATNAGGTLIAGSITNQAVNVSNGLFTTSMDFGNTNFNGQIVWLEIGVTSNQVPGFVTLTPRQQVTPTPYAIYSSSAGTAASVPAGVIGAAQIAPGAVNSNALANGSIGINQISGGTPTPGSVLTVNSNGILAWQPVSISNLAPRSTNNPAGVGQVAVSGQITAHNAGPNEVLPSSSITITTTGRPVMIFLTAFDASAPCALFTDSDSGGQIAIQRDGSNVALFSWGSGNSPSVGWFSVPGSVVFMDFPAAGVHTYVLEAVAGTDFALDNGNFIAFEL